jgi:hypothetical protein
MSLILTLLTRWFEASLDMPDLGGEPPPPWPPK